MTAVRQARREEVVLRKAQMSIGGQWVEGASGEVLEVEDLAKKGELMFEQRSVNAAGSNPGRYRTRLSGSPPCPSQCQPLTRVLRRRFRK